MDSGFDDISLFGVSAGICHGALLFHRRFAVNLVFIAMAVRVQAESDPGFVVAFEFLDIKGVKCACLCTGIYLGHDICRRELWQINTLSPAECHKFTHGEAKVRVRLKDYWRS